MSKVEVVILQSRGGPGVSYRAGQRATFSEAKAQSAIANGWAKLAPKKTPGTAKKVVPPVQAKVAEPNLSTITGVLAHFGSDVDKMKEYAEEKGIYVHPRSRKAATIAKKIAKGNK